MIVVTALESVYTLVFMSLDRFLAGRKKLLEIILKIENSFLSSRSSHIKHVDKDGEKCINVRRIVILLALLIFQLRQHLFHP
jgi:hypothetical protein